MKFSEREGITPARTALQVNFVDEALKNSLWNVLHGWIIKPMLDGVYSDEYIFFTKLWTHHYKLRRDQAPEDNFEYFDYVEERIFQGEWYQIYDFIQFCLENFPTRHLITDTDLLTREHFRSVCNNILKREMSGWRVVGNQVTRLTSPVEIGAVEAAQVFGGKYKPIATHISTALKHLSDRRSPDYRNSIKEAISAVESMCCIMTNDPKAKLGDALKNLEKLGVKLHPALQISFDKLYGYTSNEGGIRHCLLEQSTIDFEDAKFMLVSCSAFVNLLKARSIKTGDFS